LAGSTGQQRHWEEVMTRDVKRDPESMISRRTLVHGMAIAAGATVVGAGDAIWVVPSSREKYFASPPPKVEASLISEFQNLT
jgi:hypothetical protein